MQAKIGASCALSRPPLRCLPFSTILPVKRLPHPAPVSVPSRLYTHQFGLRTEAHMEVNTEAQYALLVFTGRVGKSQIPLRYLVADRSEAGRRPASSLLAS